MFKKYYAPEESGSVNELDKEVLENVAGGFISVVPVTAVCPNCGRELPASQITEGGCVFCRTVAAGTQKKKRKIDS